MRIELRNGNIWVISRVDVNIWVRKRGNCNIWVISRVSGNLRKRGSGNIWVMSRVSGNSGRNTQLVAICMENAECDNLGKIS